MLTDAIADIDSRVTSQAGARVLEVDGSLGLGQITTSQICRTSHKVWKLECYGSQNNFGVLPGGLRGVAGLVDRQGVLPSFRKLSGNPTRELRVFLRVSLAILGKQGRPSCLKPGAPAGGCPVCRICLTVNVEGLVLWEIGCALERLNVVGLEGCERSDRARKDDAKMWPRTSTMDTMSTLLLRTIPDRRSEPDNAGLGLLAAGGCDRVVDSVEVATVIC